jgi:hypothetical protein
VRVGLALAAVAVVAGVVLFATRRTSDDAPPDEALEPLAESPRPPVTATPPEPKLAAAPPPTPTAVAKKAARVERAALVEERNARAREHRESIARYEAGVVSITDVEQAEARLLDARHRLGELDGPAWHRARAVLAEREAERAKLRFEAGVTPAGDEERARLALELERLLAGDPNTYDVSRQRFLESTKARNTALSEAGFAAPKTLEEEFARLAEQFPDPETAKARDR